MYAIRSYYAAKKQIDTYWYLSRVGQVQIWLDEVKEKLHQSHYLRSSQWLVLQQRMEADTAWLPALPPAGLLDTNIDQIFSHAHELLSQPIKLLKASRERHVTQQLQCYRDLFDTIESMPLTDKQLV